MTTTTRISEDAPSLGLMFHNYGGWKSFVTLFLISLIGVLWIGVTIQQLEAQAIQGPILTRASLFIAVGCVLRALPTKVNYMGFKKVCAKLFIALIFFIPFMTGGTISLLVLSVLL